MAPEKKSGSEKIRMNLHETPGGGKPVRRTFPGPRNAGATLRVAVERAPYAELIAHAKSSLEAAKPGDVPSTGDAERLRALEQRVGQLVQALDDTRTFHYRFMLVCGFIFCLATMAVAGYSIYSGWSSRLEPPKLNQIVPVPVQIGDKTVILGGGHYVVAGAAGTGRHNASGRNVAAGGSRQAGRDQ